MLFSAHEYGNKENVDVLKKGEKSTNAFEQSKEVKTVKIKS